MRPIACTARSRALGLALTLVGALALAAPAHAQWGQQQLGTVLAVPMRELGSIYAQNLIRGRNVNFIAMSSTAVGAFNNQIAIIGITQRNGFQVVPAKTVFLPTRSLGWVKQVNFNKTIVEQTAIGDGNTQVTEVAVDQENYVTVPAGTRYFLCPIGALGPIFQMNFNLVIVTQIAIGNGNTQVALVAVSQQNAGQLKVPKQYANSLVQINSNVTVVTQVAVGDGNNQVAIVNVGQQNRG